MEQDLLAWVNPLHGRPARPKHNFMQIMLFGLAGLVLLMGVSVSVITMHTNHTAVAQVHAAAQTTPLPAPSTDTAPPSETKPAVAAASTYTVPPNQPKELKIPTIGVDARVGAVGLTSTGALGTPNNIYDTSWYNQSALPGDTATSKAVLIDGHVHGPTLPGVFMNLSKLKAGETITVIRGDGQSFNYQIVKVQNYDVDTLNMAMVLSSIQPGRPGLNLITCGGPYDKVNGVYTQRTVVFAVQV